MYLDFPCFFINIVNTAFSIMYFCIRKEHFLSWKVFFLFVYHRYTRRFCKVVLILKHQREIKNIAELSEERKHYEDSIYNQQNA